MLLAAVWGRSINTELNGTEFQVALQTLISKHTKLTYAALWDAFGVTDTISERCGSDLADIYSAKCWTPFKNQCGTSRVEGDCYNREHRSFLIFLFYFI
jgi:hypothetical protein